MIKTMSKLAGKLAQIWLVAVAIRAFDKLRAWQPGLPFARRRSFPQRVVDRMSMFATRTGRQMTRQAGKMMKMGRRPPGRMTALRRMAAMRRMPTMRSMTLARMGMRRRHMSFFGRMSRAMPTRMPLLAGMSLPALSLARMGRQVTCVETRPSVARMAANRLSSMRMAGGRRSWLTWAALGGALGLAGLAVVQMQTRRKSPAGWRMAETAVAQMSAPAREMGERRGAPRMTEREAAPVNSALPLGQTADGQSMTQQAARSEWGQICRDFSAENRSWLVDVEVQDAGGGLRALAREVPLMGIDLAEPGMQIALGEGGEHLEHDIPDPAEVREMKDGEGRPEGLEIKAGDGSITRVKLLHKQSGQQG